MYVLIFQAALHLAAQNGRKEVDDLLIRKGADPKAADKVPWIRNSGEGGKGNNVS